MGDVGWATVPKIASLIALFRSKGGPALLPHVAPKLSFDRGTLGAKGTSIMEAPDRGYLTSPDLAPCQGDVL